MFLGRCKPSGRDWTRDVTAAREPDGERLPALADAKTNEATPLLMA
jgi:hypothetical protein